MPKYFLCFFFHFKEAKMIHVPKWVEVQDIIYWSRLEVLYQYSNLTVQNSKNFSLLLSRIVSLYVCMQMLACWRKTAPILEQKGGARFDRL
jgi:hypothetical protein